MWAVGMLFALSGCFGTEVTEFPDGLEPLEENDLEPPMGTADEPYPEEFVLEAMPGGRYDTILGRGYIQAPLAQVWDAYRTPAVGADRRTSPEWSSTPLDDPEYDESYLVHHITYDIVTVEWDVTWRHGVVEGTAEMPEVVAIRWQKTDGSTLINTIEGSLVLRPVGDGSVTEVELAYHAKATGAGTDTFVQYMQDVYDDAVAVTHGEDLPTYE
ncbi:MAG TPA: hypothetical protein RMH99_16645 [Sandaracinaceae bacterium LLY-WYZ-13_1]|nr:hypothetical protein [Sandaracinaceae bacterium LLY-WYZ-13_1]